MLIKTAELVAVAVKKNQYPESDLKEIAFAGRSNVGKSTLINMLLNRKKLARTSSSPGKTRTINFYEINGDFRIVDLPGYGYAKVSKEVTENWGDMIESYLSKRPKLIKVIQLIDLRHPPTVLDKQMYDWLKFYNYDGLIVATKADKLSKNDIVKNINVIKEDLGLNEKDMVIATSSLKRTGYDVLLDEIKKILES